MKLSEEQMEQIKFETVQAFKIICEYENHYENAY